MKISKRVLDKHFAMSLRETGRFLNDPRSNVPVSMINDDARNPPSSDHRVCAQAYLSKTILMDSSWRSVALYISCIQLAMLPVMNEKREKECEGLTNSREITVHLHGLTARARVYIVAYGDA